MAICTEKHERALTQLALVRCASSAFSKFSFTVYVALDCGSPSRSRVVRPAARCRGSARATRPTRPFSECRVMFRRRNVYLCRVNTGITDGVRTSVSPFPSVFAFRVFARARARAVCLWRDNFSRPIFLILLQAVALSQRRERTVKTPSRIIYLKERREKMGERERERVWVSLFI